MRKHQSSKAKKTQQPRANKASAAKKELHMGAACMSAPGKQHDSQQYLSVTTTTKRSENCSSAIDVTSSRFSSCTAKTSPSTDNNEGSCNENQVPDFWDKALQASVFGHQGGPGADHEQEALTPSRVRACSDQLILTTSSASQSAAGTTGNRPMQKVREIKAATSQNYQSASNDSGAGKQHSTLVVHPQPSTSKRQQAATTALTNKTRSKPAKTNTASQSQTQAATSQQPMLVNDQTGLRITTPYPGKYKTVMCRFFNRGETCPFGIECNYAHGKSQLKQRDSMAAAQSPTTSDQKISAQSQQMAATIKMNENGLGCSKNSRMDHHMMFKQENTSSEDRKSSGGVGNSRPQEETKKATSWQNTHLGAPTTASLLVKYSSSDSEKDDAKSMTAEEPHDSKREEIMGIFMQRDMLRPSSQEPISVQSPGGGAASACSESKDFQQNHMSSVKKSQSTMINQASINHPHSVKNVQLIQQKADQKKINKDQQTTATATSPMMPAMPRVGNIYSTILAGIQNNLTLRKTQSENMSLPQSSSLTLLAQQAQEQQLITTTNNIDQEAPQLADIFEVESIKEISDLPGLEVVKRLSVFEEICPSDLDHEADSLMQLSNFAGDLGQDGLHTTKAQMLTSQRSLEEPHLLDQEAYPLQCYDQTAFVAEQKKEHNPHFGHQRNRKGKNRKYRRVFTVEVGMTATQHH